MPIEEQIQTLTTSLSSPSNSRSGFLALEPQRLFSSTFFLPDVDIMINGAPTVSDHGIRQLGAADFPLKCGKCCSNSA